MPSNDATGAGASDVIQLLEMAYHGSKEQRAAATTALEHALESADGPHHLRVLLGTALDTETPPARSLSALIYVKNCLKHTISEDALCADPRVLPALQEMLLDGALRVSASQRRILRECADVLIGHYDWNYLPRILPLLEQAAMTQAPCEAVTALLELIYTQVKRYKDTLFSTSEVSPAAALQTRRGVCETLMRVMPAFACHDDASFALWHMMVKIMDCVVEAMRRSTCTMSTTATTATAVEGPETHSLQPQQEEEGLLDRLDEWLAVMAQFPEAQVTRARESGPASYARYVLCVKRIAIIAASLLQHAVATQNAATTATTISNTTGQPRRRSRGGGASQKHNRARAGAALGQRFLAHHAERFLLVWKGWLSHCIAARNSNNSNHSHNSSLDMSGDDAASLHRKSEIAALRYLQTSTRVTWLYTTQLRPCALAVVEQLLFPYLCLGAEEEEVFADVTDLTTAVDFLMTQSWYGEGGEAEFTPRQVACHAIRALVEAAESEPAGGGTKKSRKKKGGASAEGGKRAGRQGQSGHEETNAAPAVDGSDAMVLLNELWAALTRGLCMTHDELSSIPTNNHTVDNNSSSDSNDTLYTPHQRRIYGFLGLFMSLRRVLLRRGGHAGEQEVAMTVMTAVLPRARAAAAGRLPAVLRCQALLACERFARTVISSSASCPAAAAATAAPHASSPAIAEFVAGVMSCVTDDDARVRLFAINTVCTLLSRREAEGYLRPIIATLMHECLYFLHRVHTTFVPHAILYLTTHFAPELTTVMGELGTALVQHFLAVAFDLAAQEEGGDLSGGGDALLSQKRNGQEAALSKYEQTAFSATALLDAIATVVEFCDTNPAALVQITPSLITLLRRILEEPDNYDFMERGLSLLTLLVGLLRTTNTNTNMNSSNTEMSGMTSACWSLLPLLFDLWENGIGVDLFADVAAALDNFLSAAPDVFVGDAAAMERLWSGCTRMLLGPVVCEDDARIAAVQLIQSVWHQSWGRRHVHESPCFTGAAGATGGDAIHARGCGALPSARTSSSSCTEAMSSHVTRCVGLLLQSLACLTVPSSSSSTIDVHVEPRVRLRVWLVAAVMNVFLYDAAATTLALSAMGALEPFWRGVLYEMFAPDRRGAEEGVSDYPHTRNGPSRCHRRAGNRAHAAAKEEDVMSSWQCLSLLTRKACIVGTTAFVQTALSTEASAAVWRAHGVALLRLVEDCIFASEAVYARRVDYLIKLTARRRRRHEKLHGAHTHPDSRARHTGENVLPACTAAVLSTLANNRHTDKEGDVFVDVSSAEEDEDEEEEEYEDELCASEEDVDDDEEEEDDDDAITPSSMLHDEMDEYESPLDEVNEVMFFLNWRRSAAAAAMVGEEVCAWRSVAEYERAAGVVEEHRQAQRCLEETETQHVAARMTQVHV